MNCYAGSFGKIGTIATNVIPWILRIYLDFCLAIIIGTGAEDFHQMVMNQWQEIRNSTLMKSKFCT